MAVHGLPITCTSVESGNLLRFVIEKSHIPAAIDGKNTDIQVVQDDLQAALFVMDAVDQIGNR